MNGNPAPTVDPYHRIAEYYDLEHDDFRDDIDLLLQFARTVDGPILELGCGSGRVLAPLAEAGSVVVGLDISGTMLARAETRIHATGVGERVTLVRADMIDAAIAPGGPFGLVVFSLNALMQLAAPERQLEALHNAGRALDSHGQVIVDLLNPTPGHLVSLASAPLLEGSWTLDDCSIVDKWSSRTISASHQVIDTTIWYDRVTPDGQLTRLRTQFELRYLHLNELTLMLTHAGFGDVRVYGSYDLDPLDDASDRIIVTASMAPSEAGKS
jgi:SAM-dependent methyltransferase